MISKYDSKNLYVFFIPIKIKPKEGSFREKVLDNSMKTSAHTFHFSESTSVSKKEDFHEDVSTQTHEKFD